MKSLDKSKIRVLVLDVDGTLTDGKIYMGETGELMKAFDIKDGCGLHDILPTINQITVKMEGNIDGVKEEICTIGIIPVIITGRESRILENRCNELGITHIYQGVKNKIEKLDELLNTLSNKMSIDGQLVKLDYSNVAYCGDDINDLSCMEPIYALGGIVTCPADAAKEVCEIASFISSKNGGNGAVREVIEWLGEL
ncbi:KdsC family phosphatase [Clostridium chromiireducens]|uniref:KdsC family phosphatase n=1 Tax=Clostridium chromiireducens TaxID=225345 RepID=UPI003AF64B59